jgi:hypothetical protein
MTQATLEAIQAKRDEVIGHVAELDKLIESFKTAPPVRISLDMNVPLQPGEMYAGLILHKGLREGHHIILLPGDHDASNWADAKKWAASIGGDLPSRPEQALLFADFRDEFKKEAYWSNTAYEHASGYAWFQSFNGGTQNFSHVNNYRRARAVRRLVFSL